MAEDTLVSLRLAEEAVVPEEPARVLPPGQRLEYQEVHLVGHRIFTIGPGEPEVKEKLRPAMAALLNGAEEAVVGLVEETQTAEIRVTVAAGAVAAGGLRQAMCKVEC